MVGAGAQLDVAATQGGIGEAVVQQHLQCGQVDRGTERGGEGELKEEEKKLRAQRAPTLKRGAWLAL